MLNFYTFLHKFLELMNNGEDAFVCLLVCFILEIDYCISILFSIGTVH